MYEDLITEIPDFPIKGVNFKDISPLLADEQSFRSAIVEMGGVYYNCLLYTSDAADE